MKEIALHLQPPAKSTQSPTSPRANWSCLPGHKPCLDVSMSPPFVPLPTPGLGRTWIPRGSGTFPPWMGRRALPRRLLQSFTHGMHLLHTRELLPALIQALHTAHTSFSTCRPRYAHIASNTGILCCSQCRQELSIFLFSPPFFFHVQKGKGRAEIPNADSPSSPSSMAAPQRDNDFSSTIAKT